MVIFYRQEIVKIALVHSNEMHRNLRLMLLFMYTTNTLYQQAMTFTKATNNDTSHMLYSRIVSLIAVKFRC